MTSMIEDWRFRWNKKFPFIIAALAPFGGKFAPTVRYSQFAAAAAASYFPPKMQQEQQPQQPQPQSNVGVVNLLDLMDRSSPCGSVHIRNKTAVGVRMAKAALALLSYAQVIFFYFPKNIFFVLPKYFFYTIIASFVAESRRRRSLLLWHYTKGHFCRCDYLHDGRWYYYWYDESSSPVHHS